MPIAFSEVRKVSRPYNAAQGQRLHQYLLDWLRFDWAEWKESISEMPSDVDDMEQPDPMEENVFSFLNRCVLFARACT